MAPIVATDDHLDVAIRPIDCAEISRSPPKSIALLGQGAVRVDAGMDKNKPPVFSEGCPLHAIEKVVVTGTSLGTGPEGIGPAGNCDGALAKQRAGFVGATAVGLKGGFDSLLHHPFEDLSRIGGELDLKQLVPHFLLRATEVHEVARFHPWGKHRTPKGQNLVKRLKDTVAVTEQVAEVNKAVATLRPRRDLAMKFFQFFGVAMNCADCPDAPDRRQFSVDVTVDVNHAGEAPLDAVRPLLGVVSNLGLVDIAQCRSLPRYAAWRTACNRS
jgi:hypothetical protein